MKILRLAMILTTVAVTSALGSLALTASAAEADKQYAVDAKPFTLKAGSQGTLVVTIKPGKGLHFNKEFPAKFTVEANPTAKSTKDKLTSKDGDVRVEGANGVIHVPLQGTVAGQTALKITGNFSICSDEQCYMLRGESLTAQVTVK